MTKILVDSSRMEGDFELNNEQITNPSLSDLPISPRFLLKLNKFNPPKMYYFLLNYNLYLIFK